MQPHDSTWLTPRSRSEIEISLDIMPTIDTGIAYGVTFLPRSRKKSWYLPLADVDAAAAAADHDAGVRLARSRSPASAHASRAAMTPISAARE